MAQTIVKRFSIPKELENDKNPVVEDGTDDMKVYSYILKVNVTDEEKRRICNIKRARGISKADADAFFKHYFKNVNIDDYTCYLVYSQTLGHYSPPEQERMYEITEARKQNRRAMAAIKKNIMDSVGGRRIGNTLFLTKCKELIEDSELPY